MEKVITRIVQNMLLRLLLRLAPPPPTSLERLSQPPTPTMHESIQALQPPLPTFPTFLLLLAFVLIGVVTAVIPIFRLSPQDFADTSEANVCLSHTVSQTSEDHPIAVQNPCPHSSPFNVDVLRAVRDAVLREKDTLEATLSEQEQEIKRLQQARIDEAGEKERIVVTAVARKDAEIHCLKQALIDDRLAREKLLEKVVATKDANVSQLQLALSAERLAAEHLIETTVAVKDGEIERLQQALIDDGLSKENEIRRLRQALNEEELSKDQLVEAAASLKEEDERSIKLLKQTIERVRAEQQLTEEANSIKDHEIKRLRQALADQEVEKGRLLEDVARSFERAEELWNGLEEAKKSTAANKTDLREAKDLIQELKNNVSAERRRGAKQLERTALRHKTEKELWKNEKDAMSLELVTLETAYKAAVTKALWSNDGPIKETLHQESDVGQRANNVLSTTAKSHPSLITALPTPDATPDMHRQAALQTRVVAPADLFKAMSMCMPSSARNREGSPLRQEVLGDQDTVCESASKFDWSASDDCELLIREELPTFGTLSSLSTSTDLYDWGASDECKPLTKEELPTLGTSGSLDTSTDLSMSYDWGDDDSEQLLAQDFPG